MARPKSTFAKLDRERANQMKAKQKLERRRAKAEENPDEEPVEEVSAEDQAALLESLAALQESFEAGRISLEDFEEHRDELRARIVI